MLEISPHPIGPAAPSRSSDGHSRRMPGVLAVSGAEAKEPSPRVTLPIRPLDPVDTASDKAFSRSRRNGPPGWRIAPKRPRCGMVQHKTSRPVPREPRRPPSGLTPTLKERHESLLRELRLAEHVQKSMLPRILPTLPNLVFGAALRPSRYLAGDFYNVLRLDRDRVGIYLGDVMGHGPAAALLGVFAMQSLRTKKIEGSHYEIIPPAAVLAGLNCDMILADFPDNPFLTMIYGVIDTRRNTLVYCYGGHPPALLLRPGLPARKLEGRGPLLGIFESPFRQHEVSLSAGDRVIFYSDGAESTVWGNHGTGVGALAEILSLRDGRSPQGLVDAAMEMARPGADLIDDLTLVLLEVR